MGHTRRKLAIGICLQLIWLLSTVPLAWAQNPLRSAWNQFDRFMSDFDPLGKAIRDPLQEAIPGLRVVGVYRQWVDWNIDSDTRFLSPPDPVTGRRSLIYEKNNRYQQITSMAEVQLRYSFNPTLQAVGTLRYEYNGTYDVHDFGRRAKAKDIHWTTNPRYTFREAYLDWTPSPSWRLVVGRQQEAWGKLIIPTTDIVHGFDLRELIQLEAEDFALRRLNRFMVNLSYYTAALGGKNELKFLWIPEFIGEKYGPLTGGAGSAWNPPVFPPPVYFGLDKRFKGRPDWAVDDSEAFARWTWSSDNLTFFLMYGYLWDRSPTVWLQRNARFSNGAPRVFLAHARGHGYGGGFDWGYVFSNVPFGIELLPMTITLESFFQSDMEYFDNRRVLKTIFGEIVDNHVRRTAMRHALQFDFAFPDRWTLFFVNAFFYTCDWRKGLSGGLGTMSDQWVYLPVFVLMHPFRSTADRLNLTIEQLNQFAGPVQTDIFGGSKLRTTIAYNLSQFIELRLITTLYFGHGSRALDPGEALGPFAWGAFTRYKNVGLELNYTF